MSSIATEHSVTNSEYNKPRNSITEHGACETTAIHNLCTSNSTECPNNHEFPKSTSNKTPRPTPVKRLHGICIMPDFLGECMKECDSCEKWYHCSCMLADGNVSDCLMCILYKFV